MKICKYCGENIPDFSVVCPICAETLVENSKECKYCGETIPADAVICPICAEELMEQEAPDALVSASEEKTVIVTPEPIQEEEKEPELQEEKSTTEKLITEPEPIEEPVPETGEEPIVERTNLSSWSLMGSNPTIVEEPIEENVDKPSLSHPVNPKTPSDVSVSYDKPKKSSKWLVIVVLLLLIGGGAFAVWHFYPSLFKRVEPLTAEEITLMYSFRNAGDTIVAVCNDESQRAFYYAEREMSGNPYKRFTSLKRYDLKMRTSSTIYEVGDNSSYSIMQLDSLDNSVVFIVSDLGDTQIAFRTDLSPINNTRRLLEINNGSIVFDKYRQLLVVQEKVYQPQKVDTKNNFS